MFDDTIRDTLDEWIYFLKNEEIKQGFKAKGIQSAYEKLEVLKLPEVEQQRYRRFLHDLHYLASMAFSSWDAPLAQGQSEVLIRMIHERETSLGLEREDDAVLERTHVDILSEKAWALWNRVVEVKVQSLKKAEQAEERAEQAEQRAEQAQQARVEAEQKAEQAQQARLEAEQKATLAEQKAEQEQALRLKLEQELAELRAKLQP